MSRESRLVVVLLVMAGVGVAGLMVVANQYRRALTGSTADGGISAENAAARALRHVDGFLAARDAVRAVAARYPVKMKQLTAVVTGDYTGVAGQRMSAGADAIGDYKIERFNALAAHGMTFEDYDAVRAAWRRWRSGASVEDPALAAALAERREALEGAGLGPLEALDDAIK